MELSEEQKQELYKLPILQKVKDMDFRLITEFTISSNAIQPKYGISVSDWQDIAIEYGLSKFPAYKGIITDTTGHEWDIAILKDSPNTINGVPFETLFPQLCIRRQQLLFIEYKDVQYRYYMTYQAYNALKMVMEIAQARNESITTYILRQTYHQNETPQKKYSVQFVRLVHDQVLGSFDEKLSTPQTKPTTGSTTKLPAPSFKPVIKVPIQWTPQELEMIEGFKEFARKGELFKPDRFAEIVEYNWGANGFPALTKERITKMFDAVYGGSP